MGWFSNLLGTVESAFKVGKATFDTAALTAQRAFALPDRAGTLAIDGEVIHNTGAENVGGVKNWTSNQTFNGFNTHKSGINFDLTSTGLAVANTFSMDAGVSAYYLFRVGSSNRLQFGMSAANDLFCSTYDDSGAVVGVAWTTSHLTRITNFNVSPTVPTPTSGDASAKAANTTWAAEGHGAATGDFDAWMTYNSLTGFHENNGAANQPSAGFNYAGLLVPGSNLNNAMQAAFVLNATTPRMFIRARVSGANGAWQEFASQAYAVAAAPNSSYRTIMDCTGSHTAARAAGTYWIGQGDPLGVSGTGTLYPANVMYIDPADYPTVNALTTKLRIRAVVEANDVAPGGSYTFGLYPVTRPATSGGAGLVIYTMGTVISGSTVAVTPAADSQNNVVGSDFAIPAAGFYVIGVVTSANVATSAHVHISASLQLRNT
jgi:hypothetical protein